MIRLTSAEQARSLAGHIPQLAVTRMEQFEGTDGRYDPEIHGLIIVLEPGDDIQDIQEIGPYGLLDVIDSEERCYEFIELFIEQEQRVYELSIACDEDRTVAVIITDTPTLDERLRMVLEAETREDSA